MQKQQDIYVHVSNSKHGSHIKLYFPSRFLQSEMLLVTKKKQKNKTKSYKGIQWIAKQPS